jgi:hygromycin-B 7''-O-kinase
MSSWSGSMGSRFTDSRTVPLHTELIDQHIYVQQVAGRFELSGLIDFADARVGAPHYEFGALVGFVFKGEPGLLREFMLAYGIREAELTQAYSEVLLGWSLCHRFANLSRTLGELGPPTPSSLEELAMRLHSFTA